MWTVDSPRMLFELCELLDETRMVELVASHLGERPALSANKCTLRRVPIDTNTNWHQDGAFLGADVRTLNLWLALSDCAADAPGLEIVPRRLDTVLPTGTEGAMFDWSVSPEIVDEVSRVAPVVTPAFRAGDALLFDHLLLHRTAVEPGMTRERYAMEIWHFAPSGYPEGQIPGGVVAGGETAAFGDEPAGELEELHVELVSVRHEDLRCCEDGDLPPEVFSQINLRPSPTSRPGTPRRPRGRRRSAPWR